MSRQTNHALMGSATSQNVGDGVLFMLVNVGVLKA